MVVGIALIAYMFVIRPLLAICEILKELKKLTKELQKLNKLFDGYVKKYEKR